MDIVHQRRQLERQTSTCAEPHGSPGLQDVRQRHALGKQLMHDAQLVQVVFVQRHHPVEGGYPPGAVEVQVDRGFVASRQIVAVSLHALDNHPVPSGDEPADVDGGVLGAEEGPPPLPHALDAQLSAREGHERQLEALQGALQHLRTATTASVSANR